MLINNVIPDRCLCVCGDGGGRLCKSPADGSRLAEAKKCETSLHKVRYANREIDPFFDEVRQNLEYDLFRALHQTSAPDLSILKY